MPSRLNAVGPTKKIGRTLVRKKLRISEIVRSGRRATETSLWASFTTASSAYRRIVTNGRPCSATGRGSPARPGRSLVSAVGVARRKGRSAVAQHPLEPLSADEFRRTTEILRREGHVTETFRFASIELMEPGKQEVLAWRAGDALPRHSFAVVWNRADNKTYEATVDLTGDASSRSS